MYYIIWVLLAFLLIIAIRTQKGTGLWERLLGMNLISTKIIVITVVFAYDNRLNYLLDFAIIYALTGFIGTIFIATFILERERMRKEKGAGK